MLRLYLLLQQRLRLLARRLLAVHERLRQAGRAERQLVHRRRRSRRGGRGCGRPPRRAPAAAVEEALLCSGVRELRLPE